MKYPEPKFVNKDGSLTAYSLACGYVQTLGNDWQLFKDGCYHLRRTNREWLTFSTLTEARQAYKAIEQIERELKELERLPQTKGNLSYKQGLERGLWILTNTRKGE